jgi:hypothetical protein
MLLAQLVLPAHSRLLMLLVLLVPLVPLALMVPLALLVLLARAKPLVLGVV